MAMRSIVRGLATARKPALKPVHVCGIKAEEHFSGVPVHKKGIDWQDHLKFALSESSFMYCNESNGEKQWGKGALVPYGPMLIHPAAVCLNYGAGVFEGIKARRTEKGNIVIFRPDANAKRMRAGAERMLLHPVPEDMFIDACKQVVLANKDMIPTNTAKGTLYIRPLLLGTAPGLGVQPAATNTFLVYCAPVGPYFKGTGMEPIKLQLASDLRRATPGGLGNVKAIGNYMPGLQAQIEGKKKGYSENLYLDHNGKLIEETGASNFFAVRKGALYTAALTGTLLPGVTRDSIIQIAKHSLGMEVHEGKLDLDVLATADEAFCTGTAAVIAPVASISTKMPSLGETLAYKTGPEAAPFTQRLYETLVGIQTEALPDPFGWNLHIGKC